MNRAVFLDRDGVLNQLKYNPDEALWDSPYTSSDFCLLPGVPDAVRKINDLGLMAIVVSNQPGVAKGKCPAEFLNELDQKMLAGLRVSGAWLDQIYYCLHHPDGSVLKYRMNCECRKPKPGLLLRASKEHQIDLSNSYLIGDRLIDIQAGQTVGCTTFLVESRATNRYNLLENVDCFQNLPHAVREIIQEEETRGNLS